MNEPTVMAVDAATTLFNFPNYRVISTTVTVDSCRQVIVESEQPPGCPSCGVIATRRKERRFQRIRYIPVGGSIEVVWRKYRWYCHEPICERRSFFESSAEVPPRARSTGRLRDQLVDAVICSGRAISETAAGVAVSWWMVRAAVNEACIVKLPNVASLHRQLKELPWKGVPVGNKQSYKSHGRTGSSSIKGVTIDGSSYLGMVGGRLYRIHQTRQPCPMTKSPIDASILFLHAAQAAQITGRSRRTNGTKWSVEPVYIITSLPAETTRAAELNTMVRGHWIIEKRLHWLGT